MISLTDDQHYHCSPTTTEQPMEREKIEFVWDEKQRANGRYARSATARESIKIWNSNLIRWNRLWWQWYNSPPMPKPSSASVSVGRHLLVAAAIIVETKNTCLSFGSPRHATERANDRAPEAHWSIKKWLMRLAAVVVYLFNLFFSPLILLLIRLIRIYCGVLFFSFRFSPVFNFGNSKVVPARNKFIDSCNLLPKIQH